MGHGINKRYFLDDSNYDIAVNFYLDGDTVPGFIVTQKGSTRFVCSDTANNRRLCNLVAKSPGSLGPGEMCITVQWNGDDYQVSKIQEHLVTINGGQVPWSWDNSLNPGTAQVSDFKSAPKIYLGTNSYLTFGAGSTRYQNFNNSAPPLPKIMVSSADNSLQYMYYGTTGTAPNRMYVVRYQGTNSTDGDPESPTMVIEYHFKESTPDHIEIHIISNARYPGGFSGIYSANTQLSTMDPEYGLAWDWDDSTNTLNSIPLDEYGTAGLTLLNFDGGEGGGTNPWDEIDEDDGFAGFFVPWSVRFNGTDWFST